MKPGFYDKSKRTNVYNSIFIYKMVSLIILGVLTIILVFCITETKRSFIRFQTDQHRPSS